jgi:hypothetical protein
MRSLTVSEDRRDFLRSFFKQAAGRVIAGFQAGADEARKLQDFDDFFDSYESSYALTLNYPDEILIETARKEGIEVEGREKMEIVRELFERKGGWS